MRTRSMYPYATLAAVVVLSTAVSLPTSAYAQRPVASGSRVALAQNGRCPTGRKSEFLLNSVAEVFESAGSLEARKSLKLERVPATAIKQYVVDDSVCQALYHATVKAVPKVWDIPPAKVELALSGENLWYFRVGDYYAVLPLSKLDIRGVSSLYIFRVPGTEREYGLVERIQRALGWGDTGGDEPKYLGSVLM